MCTTKQLSHVSLRSICQMTWSTFLFHLMMNIIEKHSQGLLSNHFKQVGMYVGIYWFSCRYTITWKIICKCAFCEIWSSTESQNGARRIFKTCIFFSHWVSPFHVTGLFLYARKTSENQRFSDVFKVNRKRPWHEIG